MNTKANHRHIRNRKSRSGQQQNTTICGAPTTANDLSWTGARDLMFRFAVNCEDCVSYREVQIIAATTRRMGGAR